VTSLDTVEKCHLLKLVDTFYQLWPVRYLTSEIQRFLFSARRFRTYQYQRSCNHHYDEDN